MQNIAILIVTCAIALGSSLGVANQGARISVVINDTEVAQVRSPAADSMYFEVIGGETLIFALPDSLSGVVVESWALPKPPALGKLSERSFLWKTRRQDRGLHSLRFDGTSTITVDGFDMDRVEVWTANVRIR